ncbi:MAG: aspartate kinase [Candidatus Gastranaerophilaceae bacterium]
MRNLVVQKFGGTSVADTDKIKNVARTVIREKKLGNDVVVVVSAMGHTTDYLMKMAKDISDIPSSREIDMLLSTGEGVSIALLAMAIQAQGYDAVSMNAMQIGIITENIHNKARIINIKTDKLNKYLDEGKIVVVAGFQGVTEDGEITTLGRGGSDTSAVAVASALNAMRCDIYTDVDGVYTTDPRIVPKASKLDYVTYDEMLELASLGANVLHPRAVETAKMFDMQVRVRSSFNLEDNGTLIMGENNMELCKPVTGVALDMSQVRLVVCDVLDEPGVASKIFTTLSDENISVDTIIQSYARLHNNTNDIAFTISKSDLPKAMELFESIKNTINVDKIFVDEDIAKVSIVGAGMIDSPGIASKMFETLAKLNINIKMISTSEIKISCLIDAAVANEAVKALCRAFDLESNVVAVVNGDLPNI